jgi:hypothetical protein
MSIFGVPPLITPFIYSNSSFLSFFDVRPWLLLLYIQTLLACPSSVYGLDYSFRIFKLFLSVVLRCTAPDYSFVISKLFLSVLLRCTAPDYSFYLFKLFFICPSSMYGPG